MSNQRENFCVSIGDIMGQNERVQLGGGNGIVRTVAYSV